MNEGQLKNNNLYNDKELIDDADLGWYDYGFRSYDVQIGRFTQVDPLTDNYSFWSPYLYAGNDPITNIDYLGLGPETGLTVATAKVLTNVTVTATRTAVKVAHTFSTTAQIITVAAKLTITLTAGMLNIFNDVSSKARSGGNSPSNSNQDDIEKHVRELIGEKKYEDAINYVFESYPEEMGKNEPMHKWEILKPGDGKHHTYPIGGGSEGVESRRTFTQYSQNILDQLTYKAISFGNFVRAIFHERIHMRQWTPKVGIDNGFEREFLAYYYQLSNTTLPRYDIKFLNERKSFDSWKENIEADYEKLSSDKQKEYSGMLYFMKNFLK